MNSIRSLSLGALLFIFLGARGVVGQVPQFKIENPQSGYPAEKMGASVSVDGNTMVVGAPDTSIPGVIEAGVAWVYVRDNSGSWVLQAELHAADAMRSDHFGNAVSISGDTVVVGAYATGAASMWDTGSAYVFTRSSGVWTQQQRLTSPDGSMTDNFGHSVSISGDTIAVGAWGHFRLTSGAGAAYIFRRNGSHWALEAELSAPEDPAHCGFGSSVAVSGDTVLIGASREGFDQYYCFGSAYFFTRSGTQWSLQAKVTASDRGKEEYFGWSASLSGDTAIIGANGYGGSAYVFTRDGSTWTEQAQLTAAGAGSHNSFGSSVSVLGDVAVVGANYADGGTTYSGSSYVYTRTGSVWTQQTRLTASDAERQDQFGSSVAICGDMIAVGAVGEHRAENGVGAAYVFRNDGSSWIQETRQIGTAEPAANDCFGQSVAVSGDTAVIGSPHDESMGECTGCAYFFTHSGSMWNLSQKVVLPDAADLDFLGNPVAISGNTALISSSKFARTSSVHVFARSNGVWQQQQSLASSKAYDEFGASVSISGDTAIVGAPWDGSGAIGAGAAYVFRNNGSEWGQEAKLTASDGAGLAQFGNSVSISGDTAIIGAYMDDGASTESGSAYVFTRNGTAWQQEAKLVAPDAAPEDLFGYSVSLSGNTALIGAEYDDAPSTNTGSAYIFKRNGSEWTAQAKLTASDARQNDGFGVCASLSGDIAVIGSSGQKYSGSVYAFRREGTAWSEIARWPAGGPGENDEFGVSVSVDRGALFVGAPGDSACENCAGAAYAIDLGQLLVPEVTVTNINRDGYTTGVMAPGSLPYSDRSYAFSSPIPGRLQNRTFIRTRQADKDSTGTSFLSFDVNQAAVVHVAVDDRITTLPAWLASWSKTGSFLIVSDPGSPRRRLYSKRFAGKHITLGANRSSSMPKGRSMYTVVVEPDVAGIEDWTIYDSNRY